MEDWLKEEIETISSLAKEEAELETEIKSKKLLLRLVKEQEARDVRDLVKRNIDALRLSRVSKDCYMKGNDEKAIADLCSLLEEMLETKHILFTKVVQCGSTAYAWAISFSKYLLSEKNKAFVLEVPEADGVDTAHFEEANRGKFALYRDEGTSHVLIAQSYDFNIVKEAFNEEVENGVQL